MHLPLISGVVTQLSQSRLSLLYKNSEFQAVFRVITRYIPPCIACHRHSFHSLVDMEDTDTPRWKSWSSCTRNSRKLVLTRIQEKTQWCYFCPENKIPFDTRIYSSLLLIPHQVYEHTGINEKSNNYIQYFFFIWINVIEIIKKNIILLNFRQEFSSRKKCIFVNEDSTFVSQYSLVSFPANICLTRKKVVGHLHIGSHLIGLCQCQSL